MALFCAAVRRDTVSLSKFPFIIIIIIVVVVLVIVIIIIIIIIIIILLLCDFFSPAIVGGFLLEIEWQQVSSSLQDSSQYSGRSQQCCSLCSDF